MVRAIVCDDGSLLTSRDSGEIGPGIKHAFQCVKLNFRLEI